MEWPLVVALTVFVVASSFALYGILSAWLGARRAVIRIAKAERLGVIEGETYTELTQLTAAEFQRRAESAGMMFVDCTWVNADGTTERLHSDALAWALHGPTAENDT